MAKNLLFLLLLLVSQAQASNKASAGYLARLARNAEYRKKQRDSMSEEQKDELRRKDRERKKQELENMTKEEIARKKEDKRLYDMFRKRGVKLNGKPLVDGEDADENASDCGPVPALDTAIAQKLDAFEDKVPGASALSRDALAAFVSPEELKRLEQLDAKRKKAVADRLAESPEQKAARLKKRSDLRTQKKAQAAEAASNASGNVLAIMSEEAASGKKPLGEQQAGSRKRAKPEAKK